MEKCNQKKKLNVVLESGAEILGSVTGTTLSFLMDETTGAYLSAAITAPITSALKKLGFEISDKILAPRDKARMSATFLLGVEKIKGKLESGRRPREDNFFDWKVDDRSSAETILEGVLQQAKDEHEEKKLAYYAEFLCNISFDESITFERASTLVKIIDRLSYRQLCIMAHFQQVGQQDFEKWNRFFRNKTEAQEYLDFYFELNELFELSILRQFNGVVLGGFKNGELSSIGENLVKLMELQNIPDGEKEFVSKNIVKVNALCEELGTEI